MDSEPIAIVTGRAADELVENWRLYRESGYDTAVGIRLGLFTVEGYDANGNRIGDRPVPLS